MRPAAGMSAVPHECCGGQIRARYRNTVLCFSGDQVVRNAHRPAAHWSPFNGKNWLTAVLPVMAEQFMGSTSMAEQFSQACGSKRHKAILTRSELLRRKQHKADV